MRPDHSKINIHKIKNQMTVCRESGHSAVVRSGTKKRKFSQRETKVLRAFIMLDPLKARMS
jgi:hypothetical protein